MAGGLTTDHPPGAAPTPAPSPPSPTQAATASRRSSSIAPEPPPLSSASTRPWRGPHSLLQADGPGAAPLRQLRDERGLTELVLIAGALLAWADTMLLRGEPSGLKPKRLRYRALHTAGRPAAAPSTPVAQPALGAPLALGGGARRRLHAASRTAGSGRLTAPAAALATPLRSARPASACLQTVASAPFQRLPLIPRRRSRARERSHTLTPARRSSSRTLGE